MEKAQDYSFNKSHAACYALIAYRTAWLRAHHPREYMAALISSVMNTKDRVPFYVNACDEMGIEVLPPDVNESQLDFAVVEGKIRFGLNAVKNVGEPAARAIIRAREEGGPVRLDLGLHRAGRSAGVEQARARVARQVRRARLDRRDAQGDARRARVGALLGQRDAGRPAARARARSSIGEAGRAARGPSADRRARSSRRASCCGWRRRALGLYVSEHPLHAVRDQLRRKTDCTLADLERRRDGEIVTVGGIVSALKQLTTKKGEPMVFLRLDDLTGGAEVVVFNSVYAASRELCVPDRILVVKGRVDHKGGRDEADRARGRRAFEAVRRAHGGAAQGRRAQGARGRRCASSAMLVRDYPGEAKRRTSRSRPREGPQDARVRPRVPGRPVPDFFAEVKALLGEAAVL